MAFKIKIWMSKCLEKLCVSLQLNAFSYMTKQSTIFNMAWKLVVEKQFVLVSPTNSESILSW
ncbi:MAG: hypothetical protein COW58_14595 [Thalassolituus sp. CG17_big_fil_post_rev_8_21_14_2_50_53_8]|nr:MAG: hypothetical protein COW58_14595 [Thalassolituus sp. CG17_big_fil_post_rev_8_21_14_2_50_53_8]